MKVVIIEDEKDLAELLAFNLQREGWQTAISLDGKEGLELVTADPPDLVILDLMLPGLTGVEVCRQLRRQENTALTPVIMLTAKGEEIDRVVGFEVGADDYLVKPFRVQELLARLRALRRRSPQYQPLQLQFGRLSLDCNNRIVSWCSSPTEYEQVRLSKKEFQVLEYLMRQPKQEASQEQLLNYLYEMESERVSNVVAAQIRRLRCKLAELGCEDVIQTVQGGNYRLNPIYTDYSIEQSESIS